jgi:sporulation protein YlmC with PRC-barrel domain
MTIRSEDVNRIAGGGGEVRTSSGEKVGNVGQVYLDDETGQPSWVTVKTGLFGTQESFVPLSSADLVGEDIVVPYDKETIKGAPRMETDASLSPQEEKRLYSYYFSASPIGAGVNRDDDALDEDADRRSRLGDESVGRSDEGRFEDDQPDRARMTDDRVGDDRVGDDRVGDEGGRPRLRKYVVTEEVVQVNREEVPVDDSDRT